MPHTTHAYPFEARVAEFAHQLCRRFLSGESLRSFLLILDETGSVQSLAFECSPATMREMVEQARKSLTPHIFFDPLDDGMEYIWLSWQAIARTTMEGLVGQPFVESDFVCHLVDKPASALQPPKTYPTSWGVMF